MRVLAVYAHPDDEVLFSGTTLATFHAAGAEILVLTATLGEAAELKTPTLDQAALDAAAERREARFAISCAQLGAQWRCLGDRGRWRDLGHRQVPGVTVAGADLQELASAVSLAIERFRPALVITTGPEGATGHPDHARIYQAVLASGAPWVLGACLRRQDLRAAGHLLERLAPGQPIGSGRVVGVDDQVLPFPAGPDAIAAKRRAMDAYAPGLGTLPLPELLASGYSGRGDTLLLRAVFEVTGWSVEYFVRPSAAGPKSTCVRIEL